VLGYSRLLWLRFYPRQTMATVFDGLEAAFTYFGGVPGELLFDQMKSVILEDHRPDGGKLLENAEFLRFAAHWGFRIRACRPYRAKTKGKVERPIGYVRGNLLYKAAKKPAKKRGAKKPARKKAAKKRPAKRAARKSAKKGRRRR